MAKKSPNMYPNPSFVKFSTSLFVKKLPKPKKPIAQGKKLSKWRKFAKSGHPVPIPVYAKLFPLPRF
jgi:hypothetical protein